MWGVALHKGSSGLYCRQGMEREVARRVERAAQRGANLKVLCGSEECALNVALDIMLSGHCLADNHLQNCPVHALAPFYQAAVHHVVPILNKTVHFSDH